jgi:hypothetical protein
LKRFNNIFIKSFRPLGQPDHSLGHLATLTTLLDEFADRKFAHLLRAVTYGPQIRTLLQSNSVALLVQSSPDLLQTAVSLHLMKIKKIIVFFFSLGISLFFLYSLEVTQIQITICLIKRKENFFSLLFLAREQKNSGKKFFLIKNLIINLIKNSEDFFYFLHCFLFSSSFPTLYNLYLLFFTVFWCKKGVSKNKDNLIKSHLVFDRCRLHEVGVFSVAGKDLEGRTSHQKVFICYRQKLMAESRIFRTANVTRYTKLAQTAPVYIVQWEWCLFLVTLFLVWA